MTLKLIQQGAEAKIFLNEKSNIITKDRIKKSYRIKEIDERIRKQRTRSEKKLLEKASKIINAPDPFPLKEFSKIEIPFINGKKLSENLDSFSMEKQKEICKNTGKEIAKLHDADIIHGDLTTSNMILIENLPAHKSSQINELTDNKKGDGGVNGGKLNSGKFKIFFIDFGLGFISHKIEDKAVDLHLLKQALEAKHFKNWKILFEEVLKGYKNYKESKKVLERLKAVEKRGRYKKQ